MNKNSRLFLLKVIPLLLVSSSIVGCGSGSTSPKAVSSPTATASQHLDTGPSGLPLYCGGYLASDQQGDVYVGDSDEGNQHSQRARIAKLSPTGQLLSEWHVFTVLHGRPDGPFGLAVDASGALYVADAGDNTIKKLSPNGVLLASWGKTGNDPGEFSFPEGVAVDAQGNVYVADYNASRVQKFSSTGTLLASWGDTANAPERLNGPVGVAVDSQGDVYVADIRNHRIVKFSSEGTFLAAWDQADSVPFSSAKAIAVDRSDNLYIADDRNNRIVKLAPTGEVLAVWGNQMGGMFGITVDPQGNVYYAEFSGKGGVRKLSPSGALLATWPASCIPPG